MFRTIGKWLIDRAVEREAPLPRWLQRWIDQDKELVKFEAAARRLGPQLRRQALAWVARQPAVARRESIIPLKTPTHEPKRSIRREAIWAGAAVTAAASALLVLNWLPRASERGLRGSPSADYAHGVEGHAASISPDERDQLLALWQASGATVDAWRSRWQDAAGSFKAVELPILPAIGRSIESARASTQHAGQAIDAAMASQRRELVVGMKSTIQFFAHRLPASVSTFIGLQDG